MYDPGQRVNIDSKVKNLLVERGPIREENLEFPVDENGRKFSVNYTQIISNGEKYDRKWLVYSKEFDKVFCFYCKLFYSKSSISQVSNKGYRDWKNIGSKLRSHEISNEHITNMDRWIDLQTRLLKNKTIDNKIQEQIKKEKEHWKMCY